MVSHDKVERKVVFYDDDEYDYDDDNRIDLEELDDDNNDNNDDINDIDDDDDDDNSKDNDCNAYDASNK